MRTNNNENETYVLFYWGIFMPLLNWISDSDHDLLQCDAVYFGCNLQFFTVEGDRTLV